MGPLIGIFTNLTIDEREITLAPGDALIAYTDGVSEARGAGALLGEDAVQQIIARLEAGADAATIAERIEHDALAFSGGIASDDIAILVIRMPPPA